MHARPASKIAQMTAQAKGQVTLRTSAATVDAASIIDILTLCAVKGTSVEVEIETPEDMAVLDQVVGFFDEGFGEA